MPWSGRRAGNLTGDFGNRIKLLRNTAVHIFSSGLDGPGQPRYMITWMTLTRPTFPAPDHDHDRCTADAIDHAERVCERRAQKFTPIRRQVLQALLSSHRPLGASEVIDQLAESMAPLAQSLNAAARATGFAPKLSVVEITGTCAHCQNAA